MIWIACSSGENKKGGMKSEMISFVLPAHIYSLEFQFEKKNMDQFLTTIRLYQTTQEIAFSRKRPHLLYFFLFGKQYFVIHVQVHKRMCCIKQNIFQCHHSVQTTHKKAKHLNYEDVTTRQKTSITKWMLNFYRPPPSIPNTAHFICQFMKKKSLDCANKKT